jgi:hypothetical protein
MRHQHRHSHVLKEITTDTAHEDFSQRRVVIAARNDQIGSEVGGAREQDVEYRPAGWAA